MTKKTNKGAAGFTPPATRHGRAQFEASKTSLRKTSREIATANQGGTVDPDGPLRAGLHKDIDYRDQKMFKAGVEWLHQHCRRHWSDRPIPAKFKLRAPVQFMSGEQIVEIRSDASAVKSTSRKRR